MAPVIGYCWLPAAVSKTTIVLGKFKQTTPRRMLMTCKFAGFGPLRLEFTSIQSPRARGGHRGGTHPYPVYAERTQSTEKAEPPFRRLDVSAFRSPLAVTIMIW